MDYIDNLHLYPISIIILYLEIFDKKITCYWPMNTILTLAGELVVKQLVGT